MQWKYDTLLQEHQLVSDKSILAKIQMNATKKGRYKVTTVISWIYYGKKLQNTMEKHKNEWVAYRKKFKDKPRANDYIVRKKECVLKFIKQREKEA